MGSIHSSKNVILVNCSGDTYTSDRSGAIAVHTWHLAREATAAGWRPLTFTRRGVGTPLVRPDVCYVKAPVEDSRIVRRLRARMPLARVDAELYAIRLVKRIRQITTPPFRMVFGNDPELVVHVRRRLADARLVHIFHNAGLAMTPEVTQEFLRSADALAAVSQSTAASVAGELNVPHGQVNVVYNGVDLEEFHGGTDEAVGPPIIGFTGTFSPEKGTDLLLAGLERLAAEGAQFRLRLTGDFYGGMAGVQSYVATITQALQRLEAHGIPVENTGRASRAEVAALMAATDIAVVPSRWEEPFALVLAEAMAAGCAVLAARTGGMPEVLGEAGLYFAAGDVEDLVSQLRTLLEDAELRHRLGAHARDRAHSFSWGSTWAALVPLICGSS